MSTITLELPDDIAARLTTPEGMARAQAAVMAAFADDDGEATLTAEEWVLVDEALEQVEAGKVKPHNKTEIMVCAEELPTVSGRLKEIESVVGIPCVALTSRYLIELAIANDADGLLSCFTSSEVYT